MSCGAKEPISDEPIQSASDTVEASVETSTVSTVASEETIPKEQEGVVAFGNYLDLIRAIEAAMYDHRLIVVCSSVDCPCTLAAR